MSGESESPQRQQSHPEHGRRSFSERAGRKRWWAALGTVVFVFSLAADAGDLPHVTRWQGAAAFIMVTAAAFAFHYRWRPTTIVAVLACSALACIGILQVAPDRSGRPAASAEQTSPTATRPAPEPQPLEAHTNDDPKAIAYGFGSLWVIHGDGQLIGFDRDGAQRFHFTVPAPATDVAACGDALVVTYQDGWLGRFDPASGRQLTHYHYGATADHVVCAAGFVWTDKREQSSIARMAAHDLALDYELPVTADVASMAVGGRTIWAADPGGRSIVGVDGPTRQLVGRIPTMEDPTLLVATGRDLWVLHTLQSCLMRIDLALRREVGTGMGLGLDPRAAVASNGILYVVDYADATLRQVDVAGGTPAAPPVELGRGRRLLDVAVHAGRVYVLDGADDELLILGPAVLAELASRSEVADRPSDACPAGGG